MTLVAILTVRRRAAGKFREFERHAAQVMRAHGGRIERAIVVDCDGAAELFKEVHIVSFPHAQAFAAYRKDERLAKLAHLRDQSVIHTEILVGEDGDTYHTPG